MGISKITAITIQERNDLLVSYAGPADNGKYIGWITYPSEQHCRPLINTEATFDTPELAEQHMRDLMTEIRSVDLTPSTI